MMENDIEDSSGSDFDDDEDPDKIQVPGKTKQKNLYISKLNTIFAFLFVFQGGGKDLAAAAGFLESRENKMKQEQEMKNATPAKMSQQQLQQQQANMSKMPPNMPANMLPSHFDFMRNPQSKLFVLFFLLFEM